MSTVFDFLLDFVRGEIFINRLDLEKIALLNILNYSKQLSKFVCTSSQTIYYRSRIQILLY